MHAENWLWGGKVLCPPVYSVYIIMYEVGTAWLYLYLACQNLVNKSFITAGSETPPLPGWFCPLQPTLQMLYSASKSDPTKRSVPHSGHCYRKCIHRPLSHACCFWENVL